MQSNNKERITKLVWYFTIFSIVGLIIETVYCFITCNGLIESRKGLLIGPFCPVYGIGAIVIIEALNRFHKKPIKLFLLGTILGAIVEYALSYGLEAIYGTRFWDYSYLSLNINGRISLIYSAFWGVLSIILIDYIKPALDYFINKIKPNIGKKIEVGLIIFFILDAIITLIAISTYTQIAKEKYEQIQIEETQNPETINSQDFIDGITAKPEGEITNFEQQDIGQQNDQQLENNTNTEYDDNNNSNNNENDNLFFNKIMPVVFPNIRIKADDGQEIWVKNIMQKQD